MDEDIRSLLDAGRYREAFELLLIRYQRKVFRLAYSILGDEALAEETAQDVFLRIWKVLPSYRGDASLSTWVYVITRNRCFTQRKKQGESKLASIEEPGVWAAVEASMADGGQVRPSLDCTQLLDQLPPPYREAMRLFYLEEKSYEEVATMLGLPIGTVRTYLHRARKNLAGSFARVVK